ncbi:MAG: hypothetical protein ACFFCW_14300 [Candidatus Hodarchaeota archaeon]
MKEPITKEELMGVVKDLAAVPKEAMCWTGYLEDRHCVCCNEEWPILPPQKSYTEDMTIRYREKHRIDCPYARAKMLMKRIK